MLVLSRKVGQRIVIGHGITVIITRISGNQVAVGVEAPTHVPIRRGELKPYVEGEVYAMAIANRSVNCHREAGRC